ncbi:MAG: DUF4032 domain-containing protein, partial [bacterium]
ELVGYENFLSEIEDYASENKIDLKEAVKIWYKNFLNSCELIKREKLDQLFPDKTLGDLYLYVCTHKWYKSEELGRDIGFKEALKSFKDLHRYQRNNGLRLLRWLPGRV